MRKEVVDEIERLIFKCFQEITDHTFQSDVISHYIKEMNNNLKQMIEILEKTKISNFETPSFYSPIYRERNKIKDIDKDKLIKVAYAMSRFNCHIINDIIKNNYNQTETFEFLSNKLNVKTNTLKNYRDSFDPYVQQEKSNRKGWHQRELTPEFKEIKKKWDHESYDFIKNEVENILTPKRREL